MNLPTLVDYQQALQIPQISLIDPDLKRGTVELDQWQQPTPSSGGFALTYAITVDGQRFAMRCFHKLDTKLRERYVEIGEFVRRSQGEMPFLVDVRYVAEGILVNGARHPIVRMPWIAGKRLDSWIDDHLDEPRLIDRVRAQLRDAVRRLRAAGVAHGDLQHGNILVDADTKVWLIDYDGMYLPALAALGTAEFGHRNYQHPDRGSSYGRDLDVFAFSVIDLSLDAIKQDPTLWQATGENLLFEAEDFPSPQRSELFARLAAMPALQERTQRLRDACLADFASVPGILNGERPSVVRVATPRTGPTGPLALPAHDRKLLLGRVGDEVTIVGQVTEVKVHTSYGRTTTMINFGDWRRGDFVIVAFDRISRELAAKYGAGLEDELRGAWVSLTGLVTRYEPKPGRRPAAPQIELRRAGSLRLVSAGKAAAMLAEPPAREAAMPPVITEPPTPVDAGPAATPRAGVYRWAAPAKPASGGPVSGQPVSGRPVSGQPVSGRPASGQPRPARDPWVDDVAVRASAMYSTPGFASPPQPPPPPAPPPPAPAPPPNPSWPPVSPVAWSSTPAPQKRRRGLREWLGDLFRR